jgi:hypothetical protein
MENFGDIKMHGETIKNLNSYIKRYNIKKNSVSTSQIKDCACIIRNTLRMLFAAYCVTIIRNIL